MLYVFQIFHEFSTYFTETFIWAPRLYLFFKKMFKLSLFFNSVGKSFQRIAPILLTVSKQDLFPLLITTPDLRLKELFSLKLNTSLVMGGKRPIFTLYITVSN